MTNETVQHWVQNYHAVGGSITLTALVSLVPIVFFLLALTLLKLKGHVASFITMIIAAAIAIWFGMPATTTASAGLYGILFGLWPIGWIVLWAIYIYNIIVKTGKFDIIRAFITSVSPDMRIQVLLIAFAFGIFLEGVAGFGIPIAIGAGLLLGCGMRSPILAAATCLVSNMASAPTGAIGIPVIVAAKLTNLPIHELSVIISGQLMVIVFILPFWLTVMVDGFKGIGQILPMILVVGVVSIVAVWFSYAYAPELSDVILGIANMLAIFIFSKIWKPSNVLLPNGDRTSFKEIADNGATAEVKYSVGQIFFAWTPYMVLTVLALLWTIPGIKAALNTFSIPVHLPHLDGFIVRGVEVDPSQHPLHAIWNFDILKAVGTAIFFTAIYTLLAFRVKVSVALSVFGSTVKQLIFPVATICFVLGFAKIADFSGQTASIALLLAGTGKIFPLVAPLLGTLGVFLTGSVTNSNALFASVQQITGTHIGTNPTLLVASNTLGSIPGKVISPQSIAIGCAATNNQGHEGALLANVLKHAIIFAIFICVMTYLQATVLSFTVPTF